MIAFHPDKQQATPKQAFFPATDPSIQAQCDKVFNAQNTLLTQVARSLYQDPEILRSIEEIHETLQPGVSPTPSGPSPRR